MNKHIKVPKGIIRSNSNQGIKNSKKELEQLFLNYHNQSHLSTYENIRALDCIILRQQKELDDANLVASRIPNLENQLVSALNKIDSFKNTSIFKIALNRISRFIGFKLKINLVKVNKRIYK